MEEILWQLERGKKAYFRGGKTLKSVLTRSKAAVSGEDALLIYNTYAIKPEILKILFYSHGLEMDDRTFSELLADQKERMKNSKLCTVGEMDDRR